MRRAHPQFQGWMITGEKQSGAHGHTVSLSAKGPAREFSLAYLCLAWGVAECTFQDSAL